MDRLGETELSSPKERAKRRRLVVHAYLWLSEDDCELRAADRVTDATWREWLDGIRTQLADPEFRNELDAAPEGQLQNLRQLVGSPDDFELSITAPRIRQRRGL